MNDQELDKQLTYDELMCKVITCVEERYAHSGKNLYKTIYLATVECIDNDEDMWTIIHHNCRDVSKAFYAGSLEHCLCTPFDLFRNDCRNTLLMNKLRLGE